MKLKFVVASLFLAAAVRAGASSFQVSTSGAFFVVQERRGSDPVRSIMLRKSAVTSVVMSGTRVVLRTSELETSVDPASKSGRPQTTNVSYVFDAEDDTAVRRLFNDISTQAASE